MKEALIIEHIKKRVHEEIGCKSFSRPFYRSIIVPVGGAVSRYDIGSDIYYLINEKMDTHEQTNIMIASPDNFVSCSPIDYVSRKNEIISFRNYLEIEFSNQPSNSAGTLRLDFMVITPEF